MEFGFSEEQNLLRQSIQDFAKKELQLGSFPTILVFPKNSSRPIKYPSEKRDVDSLTSFLNLVR